MTEELLVLGVGPGPSALDEVDAELVEPLGDAELIVHRQAHALHLCSVPQGRVVQRHVGHVALISSPGVRRRSWPAENKNPSQSRDGLGMTRGVPGPVPRRGEGAAD